MFRSLVAAPIVWALTGSLAMPCGVVAAQSAARTEIQSKRETISKMLRPVSIKFEANRLEDVMSFIQQLTGADMDIMWLEGNASDGLDKETPITIEVKNVTALLLLEKVIAKAQADSLAGANGWQMADTGEIQVGPKSRLNAFRRVEIYDINDLLLEIPDYDNAPEFDLSQVLQQSGGGGGGGGGQSPFQYQENNNDEDRVPRSERAEELKSLITELVEFDQWVDNGGDAASIRYWQGSFIVNAPDYVHRQLGGYAWWPAQRSAAASARVDRRYVTLDASYDHATIDGFVPYAVPGVVGGGGGNTPPPGGGG